MRPILHGETITRLRPVLIPDPDSPDTVIPDSTHPPAELRIPGVAWYTQPETLQPDPPRTMRMTQAQAFTRDPAPDIRTGDTVRRDRDGTMWEVTSTQLGLTSPFTGRTPGSLITCQRPTG